MLSPGGYVIYLYKTIEKLNDETKFWFLTVTDAVKELTERFHNEENSRLASLARMYYNTVMLH